MWGPVVEVLQGFTGRHPDGGDVLADWVGMLLAWGMLMMPPLSWVHRSWIKAVGPGTQAGSVPG
jgi:VanZ family protein